MAEIQVDSRPTPRVGRWLIYGILDSRNGTLIYVGKPHKRREIRLAEHIERALEGAATPVHKRIREILVSECFPEIFVLKIIPANESWQDADKDQIGYWRNIPALCLPIVYPPQTRKSGYVKIKSVELLNLRKGG